MDGIHCISRSSWHLHFMREHSLVELTEHDNSDADIIVHRPGSSEVPHNPLTRWDVSSIPANGIFLTKKQKNKNKNAQRVEND